VSVFPCRCQCCAKRDRVGFIDPFQMPRPASPAPGNPDEVKPAPQNEQSCPAPVSGDEEAAYPKQPYLKIISGWQHHWLIHEPGYSKRAFGIDANMRHDLARRLVEHKDAQIAELLKEAQENARIIGMSGEREARHLAQIAELMDLLACMVNEDDDCWFDHHGGCQAHGYLSLEPGEECPQAQAKRLLADYEKVKR
jgi:hypothetical protein